MNFIIGLLSFYVRVLQFERIPEIKLCPNNEKLSNLYIVVM